MSRRGMNSKKVLDALTAVGSNIDDREHQTIIDDIVQIVSSDPEEAKLALKCLKNGIHKKCSATAPRTAATSFRHV